MYAMHYHEFINCVKQDGLVEARRREEEFIKKNETRSFPHEVSRHEDTANIYAFGLPGQDGMRRLRLFDLGWVPTPEYEDDIKEVGLSEAVRRIKERITNPNLVPISEFEKCVKAFGMQDACHMEWIRLNKKKKLREQEEEERKRENNRQLQLTKEALLKKLKEETGIEGKIALPSERPISKPISFRDIEIDDLMLWPTEDDYFHQLDMMLYGRDKGDELDKNRRKLAVGESFEEKNKRIEETKRNQYEALVEKYGEKRAQELSEEYSVEGQRKRQKLQVTASQPLSRTPEQLKEEERRKKQQKEIQAAQEVQRKKEEATKQFFSRWAKLLSEAPPTLESHRHVLRHILKTMSDNIASDEIRVNQACKELYNMFRSDVEEELEHTDKLYEYYQQTDETTKRLIDNAVRAGLSVAQIMAEFTLHRQRQAHTELARMLAELRGEKEQPQVQQLPESDPIAPPPLEEPMPVAIPVMDEAVFVTLGTDTKTGNPVELTYAARKLSTYVIGGMGMGKTTLLLNLILSDIGRGDGLCVLDPHGDLTQDILARIPAGREPDVIVWEPFEIEQPFGLNLFECADISNANLVDQICSQALGTFYKLFHDSWGPQMEDLLRATFLTLIYNQALPVAQRPTLGEIPRLLTDQAYRAHLVAHVENQAVREFWQYTYDPLKPHEQIEYHRSSLNKVRRFLLNNTIRNIVGQSTSSLNLRTIMDQGQILLVNLSKGQLGEDNSSLLGSILVGKLFTAALSRSNLPFAQRRPFHLIVDEYQNFATSAFAAFQTEARKFGVDTVVAHQTRAMLPAESKGATTAVGNLICFAVTGEDAQELAGMFNNVPPEPPVTGVQPIRALSTSPWDHLTRHTHSDPQVNELVLSLKAALTVVPKRIDFPDFPSIYWSNEEIARSPWRLPPEDVRTFITEEDVRRFEDLLNRYLHKRMRGLTPEVTAGDRAELMPLGPFYTRFVHYEGSSQQFIVVVGRRYEEFLVYSVEDSQRLQEVQGRQQQQFYAQLEALAQRLHQAPIWADSGQFQEIRDKPRLFSDVAAETANTLSTLQPYHALCKIIDTHGNRIQCHIKTAPFPALPSGAIERVAYITQRARAHYGRARQTVEQAIAQRTALPAPQPTAISERPAVRPAKPNRPAATPGTPPAATLWEPLDPT